MTDSVFEGTTTTVQTGVYETLVGPDKKFKTPEDLAKSRITADQHIANLEAQLEAQREELKKLDNVDAQFEELKTELNKYKSAASIVTGANTQPSLSADKIDELVEKSVTKMEAQRTANQNIEVVNQEMIKLHGSLDKAKAAFASKASELGMSVEELKGIASKSPTAFMKLVSDTAAAAPGVQTNFARTDFVKPPSQGGVKEGSKAYFDQIRKEKGRAYYFSPGIQQAIIKAKEAGTY